VEDETDIAELKELIEKHQNYTGSEVAGRILDGWDATLGQFLKVMPIDYKRALQEQASETVAASD
jgi:glutamate synthase (NADPH/NADH) large chain